jgi:hypothetical protein
LIGVPVPAVLPKPNLAIPRGRNDENMMNMMPLNNLRRRATAWQPLLFNRPRYQIRKMELMLMKVSSNEANILCKDAIVEAPALCIQGSP